MPHTFQNRHTYRTVRTFQVQYEICKKKKQKNEKILQQEYENDKYAKENLDIRHMNYFFRQKFFCYTN